MAYIGYSLDSLDLNNDEEKIHIEDSLETLEEDNKEILLACENESKPSEDLIKYIQEIDELNEPVNKDKRNSIRYDELLASIYGWSLSGPYFDLFLDEFTSKKPKNILPYKHIKVTDNNRAICSGICPICKSKLIRGKKNKKNGYKRVWTCRSCNENFTIES